MGERGYLIASGRDEARQLWSVSTALLAGVSHTFSEKEGLLARTLISWLMLRWIRCERECVRQPILNPTLLVFRIRLFYCLEGYVCRSLYYSSLCLSPISLVFISFYFFKSPLPYLSYRFDVPSSFFPKWQSVRAALSESPSNFSIHAALENNPRWEFCAAA